MLQGLHTPKEPLSTGFNQDSEQPITFEKFLELTEIASGLVSLERHIIARETIQRKNAIFNKKRIMPPMLERGLRAYNPQENEKITARKLSAHLSAQYKLQKNSALPKIQNRQKMKCGRKWNFLRMRDEINLLPPRTLRQAISQPKVRQPSKRYSDRYPGRFYTEQNQSYQSRRFKSREHH